MSIKNRDLFYLSDEQRHDNLFVITEQPLLQSNIVSVRIDMNEKVAVLDKYASIYPSQPKVSDIRSNKGSQWLLSGGTLITDRQNRIAIGLRDGNAADPFTFTNIGAGRCDQKLEDHCYEELSSEFILCVQDEKEIWHQIDFGPHTKLLYNLNKECIKNKTKPIVKSIYNFGGISPRPEINHKTISSKLPNQIKIEWYDGNDVIEESLTGYVFIDNNHNTTEFRLAINIDLSFYTNTAIFFGEGTGYAEWMKLNQINNLITAQKISGREFITPFLREL
ncbi:MAG: hypothetical protein A2V66_15235 [Ignavibacteria bacterium RBG_13_36_8]|nr:MAG: hypothetical protein A2V66_15235 [Ignavibacteria bacterium RBG_13_36_8]